MPGRGFWKPCLPLADGRSVFSGHGCLPGQSELVCHWLLQVSKALTLALTQRVVMLTSAGPSSAALCQPLVRREQVPQMLLSPLDFH